jgi:hypothetical protein
LVGGQDVLAHLQFLLDKKGFFWYNKTISIKTILMLHLPGGRQADKTARICPVNQKAPDFRPEMKELGNRKKKKALSFRAGICGSPKVNL